MSTNDGPLDARGHVEKAAHRNGVLRFSGWMFRLGQRFDRVLVSLDGDPVGEAVMVPRADVTAAHPTLEEAQSAGFEASVPYELPLDSWHVLGITGHRADVPVAALELEFRMDFDTALPTPPIHLMERVTQIKYPVLFKLDGLRTLRDMLHRLDAHVPIESVESWLDWGCGCGRVTAPLHLRLPRARVSGCDVDGEAVAWCAEHLDGMGFEQIRTDPPTGYPADSADVILAYSIFTHMAARKQLEWLAECRRLLRPGGYLLATLHGLDAARISGNDAICSQLASGERGISDELVDPTLDAVLPPGEYRSVFQTEAYTRQAWSDVLDIVEYIPHGSNGFQDLVILRA